MYALLVKVKVEMVFQGRDGDWSILHAVAAGGQWYTHNTTDWPITVCHYDLDIDWQSFI